ncbi:LGFP repeat-containing protein [Mariniluteicoccus flavus]
MALRRLLVPLVAGALSLPLLGSPAEAAPTPSGVATPTRTALPRATPTAPTRTISCAPITTTPRAAVFVDCTVLDASGAPEAGIPVTFDTRDEAAWWTVVTGWPPASTTDTSGRVRVPVRMPDMGASSTIVVMRAGSGSTQASFGLDIPLTGTPSPVASTGYSLGPRPTGVMLSLEKCGLRDDGCVQSFENGRIYSHRATGKFVPNAYIDLWTQRGAENGQLGYPAGPNFCTDDVCSQAFEGGTFFSVQGRAAVSLGAIEAERADLSRVHRSIGAPTENEQCWIRDGGCFQRFTGGMIYWSPATQAHAVRGKMLERWGQLGWENSFLGYPIGDEYCGDGDYCSQEFERGTLISSSRETFFLRGAVRAKWLSGLRVAPTTDEICGIRDGGCFQHFGDVSIYFTPATGAVRVQGAIRDRWAALGWENSWLGYPTRDENCINLGIDGRWFLSCDSQFQGGEILWTPSSGAWPLRGAIRQWWQDQGSYNRTHLPPRSGEFCGLVQGGCWQDFGSTSAYWSPATEVQGVKGAIRDHWGRNGWEAGRYGYPLESERCTTSGSVTQCSQRFQRGTIWFRSDRGTW